MQTRRASSNLRSVTRSIKSRYFVTAPAPSEVVRKPASARLADCNPPKKGSGNQLSVRQSKRKRLKSKGKKKPSQSRLDDDEWSPEESEEDMDADDPISGEPRPIRKQRRIITDVSQEDDDDGIEDRGRGIDMDSPPPEMDEGSIESSDV